MVDRIEIKSEPTGPDVPVENQPVDGQNSTPEVQDPNRPEWLPEKFNSPEDLAKAYGELEKKLGDNGQQPNQEAVNQVVEDAGLKMTDLTTEYEQSGSLSEDSYAKLEKFGIPREYVDGYIRGQEALSEKYQSDIFNMTDGRDGYTNMIQWAAQNLRADEVLAYNTSVNSGDIEQAKLAVKGLFARFSENEGHEPRLVTGTSGAYSNSVFRSTAELTQAMADPKYKTDPAYRQDVINKLSRSNIL